MNPKILYDLTQAQQRIMSTQLIYPKSPMFNIGGTVSINGEGNLELLAQAIRVVINCHDALNIRLIIKNGTPKQYFTENECGYVELIDFSLYKDGEAQFRNWIEQEAKTVFSLEDNALYKFTVFQINKNSRIMKFLAMFF